MGPLHGLTSPFSYMWTHAMWGLVQCCHSRMIRGHDHPVCFLLHKFNSYQLNYSIVEKETLALIWALQPFEVYLGSGAPLVVYTDCNPLIFLHSMQCPNQRLMCWCVLLLLLLLLFFCRGLLLTFVILRGRRV